MKKSVKILIVVLCLIILGLVAFIVVDKFIIKESNVNTIVTGNSKEPENNPTNSSIIDSYIGNTYANTDYSDQQIKINSISNNTLNFDLVIGDDYGDYTVNANASIEKNKASFNIENMLMRGTLTFQDEKIIMDITEGSNQFFNTGDRFEYIKLSQNTNTTAQQTNMLSDDNSSDYAKEYKKIIDKEEAEYSDTEIKYDLIYFNNDNIPDLVIDDGGISLYVYENGTIYTLMDHEAYGIGGSKYYNYLEKKGVVYNYGHSFADAFAGMISCDTYYILNSEHKFETISHMYPMTEDPDDEELQKQLEKYEEYYYDDNKISEQDYNSILKEFSISTNEDDYKFLQGTQTVDEVERYLFE